MERDRLQGNTFSAGLLACLIAAGGLIVSPRPVLGQTNPPATETAQPSEQSLRAAVRETGEQYGPQGKELLKPLTDLATYLIKNAKYNDALEVLDRRLAIELREYGPEHPEVAGTLGRIANLHREMGAYAKAEPLYQRSLAIREKTLNPNHPDIAASLNNLAELY